MSEGPAAGWYPLAGNTSKERYWDGSAWTEERVLEAGWYPDPVTGDQRYWTGRRWGAPGELEEFDDPDDKISAGGVALSILFPFGGLVYAIVQFAKGKIWAGTAAVAISIISGLLILWFVTMASSADAAVRYRLCQDPDRSYLVVGVSQAGCKTGNRIAHTYLRRLTAGTDFTSIDGFSCTRPKTLMAYGLISTRAYCRRGDARVRLDSRGE